MQFTYRQLQQILKAARNAGALAKTFKLNQKKTVLMSKYTELLEDNYFVPGWVKNGVCLMHRDALYSYEHHGAGKNAIQTVAATDANYMMKAASHNQALELAAKFMPAGAKAIALHVSFIERVQEANETTRFAHFGKYEFHAI